MIRADEIRSARPTRRASYFDDNAREIPQRWIDQAQMELGEVDSYDIAEYAAHLWAEAELDAADLFEEPE